MFPIVALDLETTGLDPLRDTILEIGAVKYDGKQITGRWQSLINPQRLIPAPITQLTGITNEMVRDAPPIKAVLQDFVDFVGDLPIVGHNVNFDLGFLRIHNAFNKNPVNDTFEIAAVLLPEAPRYSLGALVDRLQVENLQPHRAQEDAEATLAVFTKLIDKTKELPVSLLSEIVQDSQRITWDAAWFFEQVLRECIKKPAVARKATQSDYGILFSEPSELFTQPLKPNATTIPLDAEETTAILSSGGLFSKYLENFESRNEQIEMAQEVSNALSNSQHLMVEAGTGIGKSYAYLVPAALWATRNNLRVIVSTNTLNLQDQLIHKDIPELRNALGIDLRACVLKGRSNYLCPRRLEGLRHRKPRDANEMRLLAKILVWLEEGGNGLLSEINLTGPAENEIWNRLSAQDEACTPEVCLSRMGGICPYYKARQAALSAHIIVVNHALLLSDVVSNNRVLPEYKYLIVDEAHHLEDASTSALSFQVSRSDIERLFEELGSSNNGVLGQITVDLARTLKPAEYSAAQKAVEKMTDLAFRVQTKFKDFFQKVDEFLILERNDNDVSDYGQQVRITTAIQHQPIWDDVSICWEEVSQPLEHLQRLLSSMINDLADMETQKENETESFWGDLSAILQRLQLVHNNINSMVLELDNNTIYWIELDPKYNRLALNFAPLEIGPLMENYLWHTKESIVITSATMTTNNNFDYIRMRLNADEANELRLGSPFDYENSALLFIPTDIPEPIDAINYQRSVERAILRTARVTGGRMLVLFTSYRQLKATSHVVSPLLAKDNIQVFEQGEGASTSSLLDSFRNTERAVLLGTRSFWEGVDVPGQALSILMLAKLPFDVPSDPVIAARAEIFENAFSEYTLPEAILRFRQGFGRLIRTQSDRGVVAVLDRRVRSKQYGEFFLRSLPSCHLVEGSIENLPDEAARWMNF